MQPEPLLFISQKQGPSSHFFQKNPFKLGVFKCALLEGHAQLGLDDRGSRAGLLLSVALLWSSSSQNHERTHL